MVQEFQNRIDREIEKLSSSLTLPPAELYEPARYMLALGGKRVRPLFTLLACDLFNGKTEEALPAAMAIELFHNFTLVHDDIMDNAPLRRNQPTVHEKWNRSTAILSGDVMLVKAYQLLSASKRPGEVLSVFNDMAVKVCEGQQYDLNYERVKISVPQYFKMIELKTAVLIAASMKIGAMIGGADEKSAELLYEFGRNTGIAFQLQDDLLDVYGEKKKFGKQTGGDIIANKKTFLLLKAVELANLNAYKKEELAQWLEFQPKNESDAKQKVEAVKEIYDFTNVKKIAEAEIHALHQKAISSLEKITADSGKKKELANLTSGLLKREA